MAKKIIRLTESDLANIVRKVISEQSSMNPIQGTIGTAGGVETDAKKRTYKVKQVKGNPMIDGQPAKSGSNITPSSKITMNPGSEITMKSVSKEDEGRFFQNVILYLENGKLILFVPRD